MTTGIGKASATGAANCGGKLFGDRGYISQALFDRLYQQGIIGDPAAADMRNVLMDMQAKLLLRKRAVIESVNDFLKNICQVDTAGTGAWLIFWSIYSA